MCVCVCVCVCAVNKKAGTAYHVVCVLEEMHLQCMQSVFCLRDHKVTPPLIAEAAKRAETGGSYEAKVLQPFPSSRGGRDER